MPHMHSAIAHPSTPSLHYRYVLAATYVSPQVAQANRAPKSFAKPTADGGGYCYVFNPPYCDPYAGTFKPPWWHNPTAVVGTPPTTRKVVAFYGALLLALATSVAAQAAPATVGAVARHPIRVRGASHASVASLVAIGGGVALLGWWIAESIGDGMVQGDPSVATILGKLGSAAGHTLNLLLGLATLPVGKQTSAAAAFGLSWEAALGWHRWVGGAAFVAIACHVGLEMGEWGAKGVRCRRHTRHRPPHTPCLRGRARLSACCRRRGAAVLDEPQPRRVRH